MNTMQALLMDTSLVHFSMSQQNSHTFSSKQGLKNLDRPQRAKSYKINYYGHYVTRITLPVGGYTDRSHVGLKIC